MNKARLFLLVLLSSIHYCAADELFDGQSDEPEVEESPWGSHPEPIDPLKDDIRPIARRALVNEVGKFSSILIVPSFGVCFSVTLKLESDRASVTKRTLAEEIDISQHEHAPEFTMVAELPLELALECHELIELTLLETRYSRVNDGGLDGRVIEAYSSPGVARRMSGQFVNPWKGTLGSMVGRMADLLAKYCELEPRSRGDALEEVSDLASDLRERLSAED